MNIDDLEKSRKQIQLLWDGLNIDPTKRLADIRLKLTN